MFKKNALLLCALALCLAFVPVNAHAEEIPESEMGKFPDYEAFCSGVTV